MSLNKQVVFTRTSQSCPDCGKAMEVEIRESEGEIEISYVCPGCGHRTIGDDDDKAFCHLLQVLAEPGEAPVNQADLAVIYKDLADRFYGHEEYVLAREYYAKALAVYEQVFGHVHLDTATACSLVGNACLMLGESEEAVCLYERALHIRERILEDCHPHIASSHEDMGTAQAMGGDHAQALLSFQRALTIREELLGMDHPDTCVLYWKIALVLIGMEDYRPALEYLERSRYHHLRQYGEDHPKTANVIAHIAFVHYQLGGYEAARDCYSKSLAVFERELGATHPRTVGTCYWYAKTLHTLGAGVLALHFIKRVLEASPQDTAAITLLAKVCQQRGEHGKALALHERCLELKRAQGATWESIHETMASIVSLRKVLRNRGL